jgi:hypothetical protein
MSNMSNGFAYPPVAANAHASVIPFTNRSGRHRAGNIGWETYTWQRLAGQDLGVNPRKPTRIQYQGDATPSTLLAASTPARRTSFAARQTPRQRSRCLESSLC